MSNVWLDEGNLERASTVTTEARSRQCPANQGRLTVGGVAAKLSISSCVTQTFPVVWPCDTPQSQVREVRKGGRVMKDREREQDGEKIRKSYCYHC